MYQCSVPVLSVQQLMLLMRVNVSMDPALPRTLIGSRLCFGMHSALARWESHRRNSLGSPVPSIRVGTG